MYQYPDYLYHHGVKGMKWGVRKQKRMARKDAKEYARAKMYYGEGAGNRRKLIKNTVNQRSKNSEIYKNEFDKQLQKQDMAKHASGAKKERKINDVKSSTAKTARGIVNVATGNVARASASAVVLYAALHYTGADKVVANYAKSTVKSAVNNAQGRKKSRQIWEEMARNEVNRRKSL